MASLMDLLEASLSNEIEHYSLLNDVAGDPTI